MTAPAEYVPVAVVDDTAVTVGPDVSMRIFFAAKTSDESDVPGVGNVSEAAIGGVDESTIDPPLSDNADTEA